jgi:hypothetical protein
MVCIAKVEVKGRVKQVYHNETYIKIIFHDLVRPTYFLVPENYDGRSMIEVNDYVELVRFFQSNTFTEFRVYLPVLPDQIKIFSKLILGIRSKKYFSPYDETDYNLFWQDLHINIQKITNIAYSKFIAYKKKKIL